MILIDTSAWIEYLRATGSAAAIEVRRLLSTEADRVVMCEPVAMEILSGAVDDDKHAKLERLVNGLPSLKIDDAVDFRSAAAIYRAARHAGQTIRSINDCLIAALSIRHGASIIHRDADFEVVAAITGLEAKSFR
ncbi:type II toxin-antitoxin system VapC family toxin [Candidatus Mycolicibacterium alkanivorans]|uniref:Ribonuclease VapC n=1 Tax=Candidatus Mycolicibacterium alkanivorans TaxID=2954114 RepID=A0ABS9YTD4_9MYCO|nr:PIN domain nuclease [Candidatus Mycolicibacterium alkanivorans]MCI4674089.1 PIN domain nuclease [Candidatus Mycolicibacterium alkanivorans]